MMVGLWHMDGTDGLQYIGGIAGRNEVVARGVSYIPTTPRLGMFGFASLQLHLSALALRRALSIVLYASMIGPYLAFIVSLAYHSFVFQKSNCMSTNLGKRLG